MNNNNTIGRWLFAVAFIVFGLEHFIYHTFVDTLVPAWLPWHSFFTYFTGIAFILGATSILLNKYVQLTGILMGIMLGLFILLIHVPIISAEPQSARHWTRFLQDVAIGGSALMVTRKSVIAIAGRYLFGVAILFLGLQHFGHVAFATAPVPAYFPAASLWDHFVGALLILLAIAMITNRYLGVPAALLGAILLFFTVAYNLPTLVAHPRDGVTWTYSMLDVAIAGGAFMASAMAGVYRKPLRVAA